MKKNFIVTLAMTVLLLPFSVFAEKAVFVSPENLPPKLYEEGGQLQGTYVDIIREVCKQIGIEPEFQPLPWERAVMYVRDGEVDAIFPPFFTEERAEFLYFPAEPMSFTRNVVFARKSSGLKVNHPDDLRGLIVGINRGYSYGQEFDAYKENLTLLDYSKDEEQQIKKLATESPKRMDVAVASEEPFRFLSKKLGLSDVFEVIYVFSEKPSYVAFSKATGEKGRRLSEKFGETLIRLKKEGVIQKIEDKYFK